MIICSATSSRHAKALAEHVVVKAKANGNGRLGCRGIAKPEWILIDSRMSWSTFRMLPATRELYNLEKLWGGDKCSWC